MLKKDKTFTWTNEGIKGFKEIKINILQAPTLANQNLNKDFMMYSLISIVGVVITRKYHYHEWSRKINQSFIFNEWWKGVCEGEGGSHPQKPTSHKELAIWENKNNKA